MTDTLTAEQIVYLDLLWSNANDSPTDANLDLLTAGLQERAGELITMAKRYLELLPGEDRYQILKGYMVRAETAEADLNNLRDEVGFWRGDLAARLSIAVGIYKHCIATARFERAIEIRENSIRPWLASLSEANAKQWYALCDICGEFVRPDQPETSGEEIYGHAACLLDDPSGCKPEGTAWQDKAIAAAKQIIGDDIDIADERQP